MSAAGIADLKQELIVRIEAYAQAKGAESLFLHRLAAEEVARFLETVELLPVEAEEPEVSEGVNLDE